MSLKLNHKDLGQLEFDGLLRRNREMKTNNMVGLIDGVRAGKRYLTHPIGSGSSIGSTTYIHICELENNILNHIDY